MALQNITSGDSNPGSVTPNGITPENALNKLRRRADGPPRQETFFSIDDQPTKNWAYAVFVKVHMQNAKGPGTEWTDWVTDWIKPNHFRSSEGAQRQLVIRLTEEKRKVELGLLDFKIEPKYIGYIPGGDEAWIKD